MAQGDVEEIIIQPMQACFMAGAHIRGNRHARQRALAEYVSALEHFDRDTLTKAWSKVRDEHELVIWPVSQQFVAAARMLQARPIPPSESEQRRERAIQMTGAKIREYRKTSHLYREAVREGWSANLLEFVRGEVWIQAQILCGCKSIGFDAKVSGKKGNATSASEAYGVIRRWMGNRFLEEGKLRVEPPPAERIKEWKDNAAIAPGPMVEGGKEVEKKGSWRGG